MRPKICPVVTKQRPDPKEIRMKTTQNVALDFGFAFRLSQINVQIWREC